MTGKHRFESIRCMPAHAGVAVTLVLLALVAAAAVTTVDASTSSSPASPASVQAGTIGGSFRFPVVEPNSLDPADPDTEGAIVSQIFEGLTKWDDDHEPLSAMARSWESSDAQFWTFRIRTDAQFHNGRQVTAHDVVYSWERVAAEGHPMYDSLVDPLLDTVTAVSSDTLQVLLNEPFAPFPSLLALPFMSVVPSETVGTIHSEPVGSGPFQFGSWAPGDSIVLEHNDDYYGGRPFLDSIAYEIFAGEDEMFDDYLLGGLDLSPVPDDRLDEVAGDPNAIAINRLGFHFFGMKVDGPPFDDLRVRRALNHAVDRQDIVDNATTGYRVLAEGPIPPGMQGYDPPVLVYEYNPTLALGLLAQAGWTDTDLDGVLDDGAGTDLTIELWCNSGAGHEDLMELLAGDLRDIGGSGLGAIVNVNYTDSGTYYDNLDSYPFYRMGWYFDFPDPENYLSPFMGTLGEWNHTHYSNPQVDALLDEARATLDQTGRQALYRQIEDQVQQDAPFIAMFYPGKVYVHSDDVLGLVIPAWGPEAIQMEEVQLFQHDHDVMVQEILFPKESVLAGEPMAPVVKVRNAGRNDEVGVPVLCRILQESTEVYEDTVILQSWVKNSWGTSWGENEFFRYTSLPAGDYSIECTTLLPGDDNPGNDQKAREFTVTDDAFYDAFIRDHKFDDGSVCTDRFWASPDIWNRRQPDGIPRHQDPILGQENHVYVRVRSNGTAPVTNGTVQVYYHDPSAGIRSDGWVLAAKKVDEAGIIPIYHYMHYETAWVPNREGHSCLLARFSAPDDPVTAECDVACDNNIAQRNMNVVSLEEATVAKRTQTAAGQAGVSFEVQNIFDLPAPVDLIVERGTFPSEGALELEFSRDLFSRWLDAGGTVEGGIVIPDTTRISATHPASTTIVGLPLGVREMQQARMHLRGAPGAEFDLHVRERIHGQVVGGMTYHTPLPWFVYMPLVLRE